MCGIFGYNLHGQRPANPQLVRAFLEQLFLQSKIRGLHASGMAWADGKRVHAFKAPLPADQFIQTPDWEVFCSNLPDAAIFHTRYSTSGDWENNRNNQPVATNQLAIVHNGLVSMATKEEFEAAYRVKTNTENDSEIILQKIKHQLVKGKLRPDAIREALAEIHAVHPPIFACGLLLANGEMYCFRDHIRPLYRFYIDELQMSGFCSTLDIFERATRLAGLKQTTASNSIVVNKCDAYYVYEVGAPMCWKMDFDYPDDHKFERPPGLQSGVEKSWLQNDKMIQPWPDFKPNSAIDWRDPKNRRDGFIQFYVAQVLSDIDPAFPTLNEIFDRYELSLEQQYWAAFLYSVFYENATVFLVMQEFPELEKVDIGRLERWHAKNWRSLQYQTDRRWNKGQFVRQVVSYKELIGQQTQHQFFTKLIVKDDPIASFNNCWTELHKVYKMGRHSVYAWTETLIRCLGLPLQCPSFYMDIAESSRNGLAYAIGRDDLVTKHDKKLVGGERIQKTEIEYLETELEKVAADIRQRYPQVPVDYMYLETVCCAYKGFFRRRRYLGYYLDRMAMEIERGTTKMAEISKGIDWHTLWQIRSEIFMWEFLGERNSPPWFDIRDELCDVFMDKGQLINFEPIKHRGLMETNVCL